MVWKSSGMDDERRWWYCLRHNRPERNGDCPGKDRLGPYATEEEAARALETVRRRNEEWDAKDWARARAGRPEVPLPRSRQGCAPAWLPGARCPPAGER